MTDSQLKDASIQNGRPGWFIPFLVLVAVAVIGVAIYLREGNLPAFSVAPGNATVQAYDGPDGDVVLVESNMAGELKHTPMRYYEALESDKTLLVDFWAPWCGPCKMLAPELDEVIRDAPKKYAIVKIDVDQAPQLSAEYNVEGIPLVVVHRNKAVVGQFGGYMTQKAIEAGLAGLPSE